jgi:hypothetical protein
MKLSSRKELLREAEQEMKKIRGKSKKIEEVAVINEISNADRMIGELSKLDPGSKKFLEKLVKVLYEITYETTTAVDDLRTAVNDLRDSLRSRFN